MNTLLVNTIILIEDRRFLQHRGIDLIAIVRAFLVNLRDHKYSQGGSTITQQLARIMYLSNEKTVWRKLKEVYLALRLERQLNKTQILNAYMALVYMGSAKGKCPTIRGMSAASRAYFGKMNQEYLTPVEIAMLVAMLKGPAIYRPGTAKGSARTAIVLGLMLEADLISQDQFRVAMSQLAL